MSINELNAKVNELRELYRMAEELESEIDAIEKTIRDHMTTTGAEVIHGTNYKITWKSFTRSTFNTKAFKQENPELAARYTTARTVRPFCLT